MTKPEYTFTNDALFKMLFVQHADLLKQLVCELLGLLPESIGEFVITNPEMPPDALGDKFCRLDINMTVDGQRVDLEIQVDDEGDYPERSLYYWARDFSTSLGEGKEYSVLPRTVVISIVDFKLFDCADYYSEYQALEVSRHTPLTDKMSLYYFELPKRPAQVSADDSRGQWLSLFGAHTEEELKKLEELEVPVMEQAIDAYRNITATDEFKEVARLRSLARHNEASALANARRQESEKWQAVVADKEAVLVDKEAALADKDAEIARLRAQLGEK
jgi:predicted transposase/invertase (TIGR01784 family)